MKIFKIFLITILSIIAISIISVMVLFMTGKMKFSNFHINFNNKVSKNRQVNIIIDKK